MIGTFNRNLKKNETWKSVSFTPNSCDAFNSYLKYTGAFIEVKHIEGKKYYHTFEKIYKTIVQNISLIFLVFQEYIIYH
jgi:hypothetical protein